MGLFQPTGDGRDSTATGVRFARRRTPWWRRFAGAPRGPFPPLPARPPDPARPWRIATAVLGALLLALVAYEAARAVRRRALLDENTGRMALDMADIRSRLASLDIARERVERFEEKLRRLTHLTKPTRGMYMGPIPESEAELVKASGLLSGQAQPALRLKLKELMQVDTEEELQSRIDDMLQEARDQELHLGELHEFLYRQRDVLARTPAIWPVRGWLTSGFGNRVSSFTGRVTFHEGIDVAGPVGAEIAASADGIVVFSGGREGYGKTVILDHGLGMRTLYAHLDDIRCDIGQIVARGQTIGTLGNTGRTTGPHLHYEVRVNDVPDNPMKYIFEE